MVRAFAPKSLSLIETLQARVAAQPCALAYRFLGQGEHEEASYTFSELDVQARAIGALLQREGARGERVLLLYPPGLEFIAGFLGCLYAGAVAVPAYPPRSSRSLPRLSSILQDARPRLVLTTASVLPRLESLGRQVPELAAARRLTTDSVPADLAEDWRATEVGAETLAFLQYTSGSTSLPKGVRVSHGNLLHNEEMIRQAFGQSTESVIVSWLPLYHDMGLIGGVLQPLYLGTSCILMSPMAFLQQPLRWLQAISRYRATTSGGPNFAYELCVRKIGEEQRRDLDLSSWEVAFNGAEPVRAQTLEAFAAAFAPCGFRREAFFPCYGLAEATLFVAGGKKGRGPIVKTVDAEALSRHRVSDAVSGERCLVGCGGPWMEQDVAIVDPETGIACSAGEVGEIWVCGPSVSSGYWERPEMTAQDFGARLAGRESAAFLRTGDLGFLSDGELFVTGRLKDLVIIRGRNHYPQDIEVTAALSHADLSAGGGAAFAVEVEGEERLVLVCEVGRGRRPDIEAVAFAVRRAIAEEHQVQLHELVLVKEGTIPKTSSGKIQRHACRALYVRDELAALGRSAAVGEPFVELEEVELTRPALLALSPDQRLPALLSSLRRTVSRVLRMRPEAVDPSRPLTAYGLDSLAALELGNAVEADLEISLPLAEVLESSALEDLAQDLLARLAAAVEPSLIRPADAVAESREQPLSRGQTALWFLHRLAPESPAYNIAAAVRVRSALDAAALARAITAIARRHSALRGSIGVWDGRPVHQLDRGEQARLDVIDATGWSDETLHRCLNEAAWKPFDLAQGPLLRAVLFTHDGREPILVLAVHHVAADFWSLAIIARELGALYSGAPLRTPSISYGDWVRRQEERLAGAAGERLWDYWRERLGGELPVLQLPTDRPRPSLQSFRGTARSRRLPEETSPLTAVLPAQGATLHTRLATAFLALLHRYTGQPDLLVGTPTAGRSSPDLADVVGYFVNPVVLRGDLSENPSGGELVARVRTAMLGALAHQDLPFPLLADRLQPDRDPSRSPLFQALFVLQRTPPSLAAPSLAALALGEDGVRLETGGLVLESLALEIPFSQFDLSLAAAEISGGLSLSLQYCTDLFDAATIDRLLGHFEVLLAGMAADPRTRVGELPLLGEAERRQLLEWSGVGESYPLSGSLHARFAAWAEKSEEAVAAVFAGESLSYGALDRRSNRLAHRLLESGVLPDSRVCLAAERGLGLLEGILGILKAGCAYVPLDPSYPKERLAWVLEDSGAAALVTEAGRLADLPAWSGRLLLLGQDGGREESLRVAVEPGWPAYVIYTSGSTGRPKGVVVSHGNVLRLMASTLRWFGFGAEDVWTLFHSFAFDFSVWELWGALLYGGRLVVVPYLVSRSPEAVLDLVEQEGVTVLNQTPSAFRALQQAEGERAEVGGKSLRWVIFGGEALEPRGLERWWRRHGASGPGLVNMYGITETTVHVTYRLLGEAEILGGGGSVIGAPLRDLRAYVLDGWGEPVPIGVAGELYVGGAGVSLGYLDRPELTAQRFVPDGFGQEPGSRLYRTGDLGRWRSSGELEYLGRMDHQVKVRGFRIEPGEIESALLQQPGVEAAVVVVREDVPGERRLVAYVVGDPGLSELRSRLKQGLPEHMVPSAFVVLESLPLTPSGKVDRRALPAPDNQRPELAQGYRAPRIPVEERLAGIWAQVLRLERVGVHDNFFALGGDSILALQIVAQAAEAGLRLQPRHLFQYQTIAELAATAEAAQPAPDGAEETLGELPLTPIQRWFFERDPEAAHHFNQSVLFAARERLDPAVLRAALADLLARHGALRLRFEQRQGEWHSWSGEPGETPVASVDLTGLPEAVQGLAVTAACAAAQASLDLGRGALLRALWLDLGKERPDRLLLVIHHLAVDGVSWRILLGELERAYRSRRLGKVPRLGAATSSYRRWAERLELYASSPRVLAEASYWLSGERPRRLPVDFAGGENRVGAAGTVTLSLEEEETRALLQQVPGAYRTRIQEVLLTALVEAFASWTGERRLIVDLEGHGREDVGEGIDVSGTVGWFTTIYPVVLDLQRTRGAGESLKAVKEQLRAVPQQGLGYGLLRYLSAERDLRQRLASLPEPDVSFNYLGQFDQVLEKNSVLTPALEPVGPEQSPGQTRRYLLEINGRVSGGRLHLAWCFGRQVHRQETVEALARRFVSALRALISHCLSAEAGGYTPADFPLAGLSASELDRLASRPSTLEDLYPLSPIQQGLLFHSLASPGSEIYFEQVSCTLEGDLDVGAFVAAWRAALERHPVLRTAFFWEGLERPLQGVRLAAGLRVPFTELDWRQLPAPEQERRLPELLAADRARGFRLDEAPLLRLTLIRLAPQSHRMVWSFHHLLADGWSVPLLLQEVFATYERARRGEPAVLGQTLPYRSYIEWLERQDLAAAEAFWRSHLAGLRGSTSLGLLSGRRERTADAGGSSESVLRLSPAVTGSLQELGRHRRLTLNTLLQGVWAVLLARYGGEQEVVFGAVTAGRPAALPGVERMVGTFINTLPVRVRVDRNRPVLAWLAELQAEQVESRKYDYSPLALVQSWSEVPSEELFESLLIFENYPHAETLRGRAAGLEIHDFHFFGRTHYPVVFAAVPGAELTLALRHDAGRFGAPDAGRLLGHLARMLSAVAAEPALRLGELPLLSEGELHQVVSGWNDTRSLYAGGERTLHELIEAQAERAPEAIAVSAEEGVLSYGELERRAHQLARFLRRIGVGPEACVGVAVERSPEMVVAVLGVLKAGGAYLPLDPEAPRNRLAMMLEDSGARVVLAGRRLAEALPDESYERVWLDADWERIARSRGERPSSGAGGDNLAYVIYTSGSTGRPKGVMVSHRSILNRLLWMQQRFPLASGDVLLHKTLLTFDASVWELFVPLFAGARLELARPGGQRDSEYLVQRAQEVGATVLQLVPSQLRVFLEQPGVEGCTSLRRLFCGGEALPELLKERAFALLGAELCNLYGPTEASIDASYQVCERGERGPGAGVPVGRPLGNVRLYLLDRELAPVPVGVAGELYVGGMGLARGYAGRPDLTAERFVPDGVSREPGGRLYRTGDRAHFLADGRLGYLGRLDHQLKVRGVRIEPEEIEAMLRRHPAVREAVVVVREEEPGDRRLVAYVAGQEMPGAGELREHLRQILPEAMLPAAFVALQKIPLLPNGKLDRAALSAMALPSAAAAMSAHPAEPALSAPLVPQPSSAVPESGGRGPRTPAEELVAQVWGEVLHLERVGAKDNFFELGGHSLTVMQAISRLRQAFGVKVSMRALFNAPTVEGLAAAIERLRGEGGAPDAPPIEPVPRVGNLPLSFAQQRLWLIDQLDPGSPAYNLPSALRLSGELSPGLLRMIFATVVGRHEALRTTFASTAGEPVQIIAAEEAPELPVVDLTGLPEVQREAVALGLAREEARRPFDLQRGPLLRLGLVRLGARDHLLLTTMHHIVSDGWSTGVLLREVGILYQAFSEGRPSPLPELPVQYADFAVWQRSWLQGDVLETQLAYWKRELTDAPRVLELPTDHPRPAAQTYRGALRPVLLEAPLSTAVRELCRREGVTPFMALLAAWALLLGRHANQDTVLVGSPIAGRNRREIEGLVGFFVNTLVLRVDLESGPAAPSFSELLGRVRRTLLDAFTHQDLPFERVIEELVSERDLSRSPLFQVLFVLQDDPRRGLVIPGLAPSLVALDSQVAKFDLTLTFWDGDDGFSGALEHRTDLFDGSTAARLLTRFEALLATVAGDCGRSIRDLPLLLPAERQQILFEWNDAVTEYPREACLTDLFEAVARDLPEAPAVAAESGEIWSYRRLDAMSNRLARRLRALGIGPEVAVGISMERSPELILGFLAILKAGGVYVPLDPAHPDERLDFMLADSGAAVLLAHHRTRERLEGRARLLLNVEMETDAVSESGGSLGLRVPAESLAYVIYTSGSTGRPKGVAVSHQAIIRLARETNYVSLGPGDRIGQVSNISFDVATYEIWGALLTGAAIVVIPRDVVLSPADFAHWIRERGVTSMFLTSALFTRMAREVPEAFATMSELLVGGEAVDPEAARIVLAGRPPRRLLNGYGPTESTAFAAWHPIREVARGAVAVPIGRPLANTSLFVLDPMYAAVPPGVVGELCIGGDGLARGYLNRPELTAERFIPHPWGAGERLYRSGDLVRQRPDGALDYLGRLDDQVKIRGFRIEPGEIKVVLESHPGVRECVVLARKDAAGERLLVAYVTGGAAALPTASEMRAFLARRLPDHMVPAVFVSLDAFPLSPNGKVDRGALPAPERTRSAAAESDAAPSDPVEELLVAIWSQVLGLERVGIHDDFFALGGHSLLATQVMSRIRGVFDAELPLRRLFEAPTVASLAREVREMRENLKDRQIPPLVPVPRNAPQEGLPLSFAQQRLWFLDQLEPGSPAYNIPSAVCVSGELSVGLLERIFAEVVRRHEALRTTFASREGHAVQIIAPAVVPSIPVVDLSGLSNEVREARALELARDEARRPFALRCGPLLRLSLVRLEGRDHLLLMTTHHIVSDGWSMWVLLQEITALYEACSPGSGEGRPALLPELPVQYADFACWQREWLRGEVLEAQISYWRDQLAGAPQVLELPLDRPRPAMQTFRGASIIVILPPALSIAVRDLCHREGATPFMVLLAAWALLLARSTGQHDLLLGSPIAGRNRQEIERLIGFFVNTLVIRADFKGGLSGSPGFAGLVARIRRAALDAYAHQDVPFERLVEELVPERDLSRSPLFQVAFALQNTAGLGALEQTVLVPGLTLAPLAVDAGVAKFDLTLTFRERKDRTFEGILEYRTDLFEIATIDRLRAHFETLLAGVTADPRTPAGELPLLGEVERRQLLEWSGAGERYPLTGSLHARFEGWAERSPDAVAVVFAGESLSYRELDRRSNRLAHRLLEWGVVPGSRVCLAAERGLGLVEGILGILKAGCAYVPLDPSYPKERLGWVLEDAGAAALVSEAGRLADLPAWSGRLLLVGEGEGREQSPRVRVEPEWPAYVIYTSGSTGRPKGVVVSHGNVLRLMASTEGWFGFGAEDVWTLFHSFAFDFSVWELWGALLYGGRLVVVPYLASRSPEAVLGLVEQEGVTVLNQTPSAFRGLQQAEGERPEVGGRSLRRVIFGGEALEPRSLESWWRRHGAPGPGLVNMYGITETTVHVTYRLLGEAEIVGGGGSVIGVPLPDLGVYVLNGFGEPVSVGVAGELYVGGAGVAPGYLGRPELTAERFVPDRFGGETGSRLYRTGDLVRWRSPGELEYLGRIDHQVKVRGFRIELGEIEAALLQQPEVEAAVMVVREDVPGERRLVAYVVGREGNAPGVEELRGRLQEKLPEHMVPSAFVLLESLPLTANGKVDRRALPAPGAERPELAGGYVAPRTAEEEVLAAIWSLVLGLERVGVHDNFFALGGDSILSLRVVGLAGERGLAMSLPDLVQHQTIAELSKSIRRAQGPAEVTARSEPFSLVAEEDRAKLPSDVEDAYPLATLQAGMLYHMELTPEDRPYHNVDSWHLRGHFEGEPFVEAVRRVVARHPILRTSFALTGYSEALQLVHRHAELPLMVEDIQSLSPAEQEVAVDRLIAQEKHRRFDLTQAPQLRFHVFRRSAETFQFTLTENHAIFDGWSLHSTLVEIFDLYWALLSGTLMPAPPLQLTYREFVRREREALASEESQRYWRDLLSGAELVELPRWPSEWRDPESRGVKAQEVEIPPDVTAGLKRLAREATVPLKSVLLAVHCKVMSVLTGRLDIVTGLVSNGRLEESEGDQVRGMYLNTLPLRLRLPEGSWADLARAAFLAEQEMLPHRRYPFGALQRQWGDRPLFDVAFNYVHFHVVDAVLASGHLDILEFKRLEPSNLGIQAQFIQSLKNAEIAAPLDYDAQRFTGPQMQAVAGYYARALAAMAFDSAAPHIAPLLSAAERHAVLCEWNDTTIQGAEPLCVHTLVERQAERTPEAVAVSQEGRRLTYRELMRRTGDLARCLRRLGVRPGSRVGICVERSPEMVVGLLGVLRAGAAYVPLDPAHPQERLAWILADAEITLLLAETSLHDRLPAGRLPVFHLDAWLAEGAAGQGDPVGADRLPRDIGAHDLAYVIYTSGSTGRPKGVQIPHGAMAGFLESMRRVPGLSAGETLLAVTTLSFDIAALEIFLPLLVGGHVEIASRETAADGHRLLALLGSSGADVLQATPATWRLLLDAGWDTSLPLRAFCGGEALPRDLADRVLARASSLWNLYGPTETTIWSAVSRVQPGGGVLLGRPIANTGIHVVDGTFALLPSGVAGELLIGGTGLARGYWKRPELTAERFVPDPFGREAGARFYRTGDLVRQWPDGSLEYLGRLDHQVKIRGFRIETGEIEAVLCEHPGVSEAVVTTWEAEPGDLRLLAYLSADGGVPPAIEELRTFLARRLPPYMLPAVFQVLPTLPRTPNGKVDRRALPAPQPATLEAGSPMPRTAVEELLAGIWKTMLGVEQVAARDSFFALGGHSLLATRLVSRVRTTLKVELPLRALYQAPTLAELAALVESVRGGDTGVQAPPLQPVPRGGELPLSFAQQRLWFVQQMEPANAGYNIFSAFRLSGRLHREALAACLSEIVRRHEALRTRFEPRDGLPVQIISAPRPVVLPLVDLAGLPAARREAAARTLLEEQALRTFDLTRDELLRVLLVRLEEEEHLSLFVIHHIVSDAWSMSVLVGELAALYRARLAGEPPVLPELPIQYADFSVWQRAWLRGEVLERQLVYWREQLAGAPPELLLPTDGPRSAVRTHRGGSLNLTLPRELTVRVEALSASAGVTLFMTLMAAYQCLLGLVAGQTDVVVGTDAANRNRLETEVLIGFLVNSLVLRTDLTGNPTFREVLQRVRETCLDAYAYQDLPFDKLVEELRPERRAGTMPLFQVAFTLQNAPAADLELPGLRFSAVDLERRAARFDLVVNMWAEEGELRSNWEYNRDLFSAPRIADLIGSYALLLRLVTDAPDIRWQAIGDALAADRREREEAEGRQMKQAIRDKFAGLASKSTAAREGARRAP